MSDNNSYQSNISALTSSQRDLDLFNAARGTEDEKTDGELFPRSLWADDVKKKEKTLDTLFAGYFRYGRNPRSTDRKGSRSRPYNKRKKWKGDK